ncbi:hypothetical protein ABPG72_014416 [Tetrahymena utriculariae]
MITVTKAINSDITAHIQSPITREYNLKLSQRSISCSNTVQILRQDANWNSACNSNLSPQFSCENFRNVEYDICLIQPSQNQDCKQSDIAAKLLLNNLFMYVNQSNLESSLHFCQSCNLNSCCLTDEGLQFKLEEEQNEQISKETNIDLFLQQSGLKCTQVRKFQKTDIIEISFIQDTYLSAKKQTIELQMQESFSQPQKDQQINNYQKLSDKVDKIDQLSENQFESPHLLYRSSQSSIQTKDFDNQESSNQFTKRFGIKIENVFPHQEFSNFKQKNYSNPDTNLKNILQIENWVRLRIANQEELLNNNKKQLHRGGSNYYVFTFDQKLQKYLLLRQVLDQYFVDLIHSNVDEITYSYLHSEAITQGISLKLKQHMQIAIEKIQEDNQKKYFDEECENLSPQRDEKIKSFPLNQFFPVSQNERSIFMNEYIHFQNYLYVANIYCEKSNEIIKKQILPQHIVLEQSYFISTEPKQKSYQKKSNKSSIIKFYSNSIKKNVSYRPYINHQYLEQSTAFQQKFYTNKNIWKRRGKNQKIKSKYNSDDELSSFVTN